jgi:hypothetical protein
MSGTAGRLVIGFIAAALAVLTVHQSIVWLVTQFGWIKGTPWAFTAVPPYGVPQLINSLFWGGLWGALFGLIHEKLPGNTAAIKGLIYGGLIALFSNFLILPFIKGEMFGVKNQVYFAGWDPMRMLAVLCILGGFGIATALIYKYLERD